MMPMLDTKTDRYRAVFDKYDVDHDGYIPLHEFKETLLTQTNIRHEVPQRVLDQIIRRADSDRNGVLDNKEFIVLMNSPQLPNPVRRAIMSYASYATKMVLPRSQREGDVVDGQYIDEYNCWPPPITIFLVTVVEVAVFIYYAVTMGKGITQSGPVPFQSPLIYDPYRRYQAWRYVTYMLIHAGYVHILFNMVIQLILGIPLEMVHKFWRVWLVYIFGVLAGSLGTSISDPKVYLAGASGGVYALITGHLATIIMNYKEMEFALVQLCGFLLLMAVDVGVAVYSRYIEKNPNNTTGYSAHLAGAIAGLLLGIVTLRNLKMRSWERVVWWLSLAVFIVFMLVMIVWNAAIPMYFPESKWD